MHTFLHIYTYTPHIPHPSPHTVQTLCVRAFPRMVTEGLSHVELSEDKRNIEFKLNLTIDEDSELRCGGREWVLGGT